MGKLSKRQVNLENKTDFQLRIIENYFFAGKFSSWKFSDNHYADLVLEQKDKFNVKEKAVKKLALTNLDIIVTEPLESLAFNYDGDYLYKNGSSSKAKYQCLFLGAKQLFAYTYTFDMTSNNFQESATEIFYDSILAISTEEKVCENEIDLYGFINDKGKRSIHTVVTLKIFTASCEFEFVVQKTPNVETAVSEMRNKIRAFKTIKVDKTVGDLAVEGII